jgi:hypothetical protein
VAIAFRAFSKGESHITVTGNTTVTVTKPTGTASTDVLVISFAFGGGVTYTVTPPTGWTAVATGVSILGLRADCYRALGSVAALGFVINITSASPALDQGWTCSAFSGVDNTTPVDATGTTSTNSNSLTLTANAVSVLTANAHHLIAFSPLNAATISATGFTAVDNSPVSFQQAGLLYKSLSATGSTGTVSCVVSGTASGQSLAAIPFALRPAGGAAFVADIPYVVQQAVRRAAFY